MDYKVALLEENQPLVSLFEHDLEGNAPRELVNLILQKGTTVATVFVGDANKGYRYVIGSKSVDIRPIAKMLNEKFEGRGGGKPEMVQGSLSGNENDIREEVIKLCNEQG